MKIRIFANAVVGAALLLGGTAGGAALAATHHHRRASHHAVHRARHHGVHHTGKTPTHRIGQAVVLVGAGAAKGEKLKFAVKKASAESTLRNNSDMDYSQYATPGTDFLVLTLHLEATAKPVKAKLLQMYVVDTKGKRYKVDASAGVALGSDNYPATLAHHKSVAEQQAFDVPKGAKGLVLVVSLGKGKSVQYALPKG